MGLINNNTTLSTNPLIKQAMDRVQSTVKQPDEEAFLKILTAGLKFAFNKKAHGTIMEGLDKSQDPVHDIAVGTVGLLLVMNKGSHGTMPVPPMVPAGMMLVLHGLDYIEHTQNIKIGAAEIDEATKIFIQTIMPKIGITPEVFKQATDSAHKAMQDPALMAKFKQHHQGA